MQKKNTSLFLATESGLIYKDSGVEDITSIAIAKYNAKHPYNLVKYFFPEQLIQLRTIILKEIESLELLLRSKADETVERPGKSCLSRIVQCSIRRWHS